MVQCSSSLSPEGSFGCKEPARMCQGSQKLLLTSPSTNGALVYCALKSSCPAEQPQEPHKPLPLVSPSPAGGEGC